MKFNGFRLFCENDRRFSNFGRTLAHSLNVDIGKSADKIGSIPVVPGMMKFRLRNQPPWEDQWDAGTVKWYEIIDIKENTAKIKEVTGKCDSSGMNSSNSMAQCSTTSGQELTITGKEFDWLMAHIAGQSNGGMGGLGGGMGGGMPISSPPPMPGGATPPPSGAIPAKTGGI
jgi:hypothetical protein